MGVTTSYIIMTCISCILHIVSTISPTNNIDVVNDDDDDDDSSTVFIVLLILTFVVIIVLTTVIVYLTVRLKKVKRFSM